MVGHGASGSRKGRSCQRARHFLAFWAPISRLRWDANDLWSKGTPLFESHVGRRIIAHYRHIKETVKPPSWTDSDPALTAIPLLGAASPLSRR